MSKPAPAKRTQTPAEWETVAFGGVPGQRGSIGVPIRLTPLTRADAAEMFPVLAAPEIYRFLNQSGPSTLAELQARYERQEKGVSPDGSECWFNWIIREAKGQKALGFVQATVKKGSSVALIGFALHPHYWGQGLAREAVGAMLARLRAQGINTFHASIDPRNHASLKLLTRLGFKKSATVSSVPDDVLLELNEKA